MNQERASRTGDCLPCALHQVVLILLLRSGKSQFNPMLNTVFGEGVRSELAAGIRSDSFGTEKPIRTSWRVVGLVLSES